MIRRVFLQPTHIHVVGAFAVTDPRHFTAGALIALLSVLAAAARGAPDRPNIVVILADDLGWMDTGVYGSEYYETPNIDRLADRGVRFTNAYSASPYCSPTRAAIMTGQDPGRLRLTAPNCHRGAATLTARRHPGPFAMPPTHRVTAARAVNRLNTTYVTLPERLNEAGYRTIHVGKWHLGFDGYAAKDHGFDRALCTGFYDPRFAGGHFAPYKACPPSFPNEMPDGTPRADTLTACAIEEIETAATEGKPFFLNLWYYLVHGPIEGRADLIARYERKTDPRGQQKSPVMGAMVASLDENVGRLLDALDRQDLTRNTLIVFTSDNGALETGHRWVGGGKPPEPFHVTSNEPLRGQKGDMTEGGIRVPFIVSWPGRHRPGTVSDQVLCATDIFPTVLAAAGVKLPTDRPVDGADIIPALTGRPVTRPRNAFVCHFPNGGDPATAVRRGDWKLLTYWAGNPDQTDKIELYNLRHDIGEATDLARTHPEKVAELTAVLDEYLEATDALVPQPNPNWNKRWHGWYGLYNAILTDIGDTLAIHSNGSSPVIRKEAAVRGKGAFTIALSLRSTVKNPAGLLRWTTAKEARFTRANTREFTVVNDGDFHEHTIGFTTDASLRGLRLDLGRGEGDLEIRRIVLRDGTGTLVREYSTPEDAG